MEVKNEIMSEDSSGKFLFMRQSETIFNQDPDPDRILNSRYIDSELSEEGIKQAKLAQSELNKLKIKEVYVSPYYRALQTTSICLEKHPNINNISVIVHPLLSEIEGNTHDFIYDIKKNKKNFSNNSIVKFDWSVFDEYIKQIKYDENFFYFNEFNMMDIQTKDKFYKNLKNYYENGKKSFFEKELEKLAVYRVQSGIRFESLKHEYERFLNFSNYLSNKFKDSLDDKENKILTISHS